MAIFTATYTSATGQERSMKIRAIDLATAKRQLRRRGIKATELRASETSSARGSSGEGNSIGEDVREYIGAKLQ